MKRNGMVIDNRSVRFLWRWFRDDWKYKERFVKLCLILKWISIVTIVLLKLYIRWLYKSIILIFVQIFIRMFKINLCSSVNGAWFFVRWERSRMIKHFIFELWIKFIVLIFRMRVNWLKIVYWSRWCEYFWLRLRQNWWRSNLQRSNGNLIVGNSGLKSSWCSPKINRRKDRLDLTNHYREIDDVGVRRR